MMQNLESFKDKCGPWCVVAGASTGIGESFSKLLAAKCINLILVALPNSGLSELSQTLQSQYGVDTLDLELDLADPDSFDQLTPTDKQKSVLPMLPHDVAEQALLNLGKGPTKVAGKMNQIIHFITSRLLSRRSAVRFISYNTKRVYQE